MKLNGTCDDRIRKGEQILNGIVEEDETTTIPCSQSSKENHSPDKHFSNTLAESVGKLVNGYTSQILEENYQVKHCSFHRINCHTFISKYGTHYYNMYGTNYLFL